MRLGVIPARGGSKRIPGKNIKPFCGRPILEYSINAALESDCFDEVIVSTDDKRISKVALAAGASVPFFRPEELADDFSGTNDVVAHAIRWYEERGTPVEAACCIYATAPFVTAEALRTGLDLLESNPNADFAVSVSTFEFPIQRALTMLSDQSVRMREPEHRITRSQDLQEFYHDAGQIYWGRAVAFVNRVPLFGESTYGFVLDRSRVQDIDTEEDWRRAELMYRALL